MDTMKAKADASVHFHEAAWLLLKQVPYHSLCLFLRLLVLLPTSHPCSAGPLLVWQG